MPPIKILFVIDYFGDPRAGTEGQLYQLILGLDRKRFEPHLLVFQESPWMMENGFPCDYSVLGCRRLKSPFTWIRLLVEAVKFNRDGFIITHTFLNDTSIIGPPLFKLAGMRSLVSRRDMGFWYTPVLKKILRLVRFCVDGVVVNSKAVQEVTSEIEGYDESEVHLIYNGYAEPIKTVLSGNDLYDLIAVRQSKSVLLVGLVANTRPIKNIDHAIRAIALLKGLSTEVHLVHLGAGDNSHLKLLSEKIGVGDRVHFLGARDDVAACLELFDIGLLCSDSEGFSNAIVEYLWAGLPVVCTNVGGNSEAVVNGFNGLLYPRDDINALVAALRSLVEDVTLREEFAKNAKTNARERFDMIKMVEAHECLYTEIAKRPPGEQCEPITY